MGFLHRLNSFQGNTIEILEIGFGTALNAMLTFAESSKYSLKVSYSGARPTRIGAELKADYESKFPPNHIDFKRCMQFHGMNFLKLRLTFF